MFLLKEYALESKISFIMIFLEVKLFLIVCFISLTRIPCSLARFHYFQIWYQFLLHKMITFTIKLYFAIGNNAITFDRLSFICYTYNGVQPRNWLWAYTCTRVPKHRAKSKNLNNSKVSINVCTCIPIYIRT